MPNIYVKDRYVDSHNSIRHVAPMCTSSIVRTHTANWTACFTWTIEVAGNDTLQCLQCSHHEPSHCERSSSVHSMNAISPRLHDTAVERTATVSCKRGFSIRRPAVDCQTALVFAPKYRQFFRFPTLRRSEFHPNLSINF